METRDKIAVIAGCNAHAGLIAAGLVNVALAAEEQLSFDKALAHDHQTNTTDTPMLVEPGMPYPPPEDGLPNRLSIDHSSPNFSSAAAFVGVRFNGEEIPGIVEYCVTSGWVKVAEVGSNGEVSAYAVKQAQTRYGKVEPYWRQAPSRQVRRALSRSSR